MIVNTMTVDEVCHELLLDYEAVARKGRSLIDLFYLEMSRKHVEHVNRLFEYKSPRHNTWLLLLMHHGHETEASPFLYFYRENGMMVYSVSHRGKVRRIVIQNGHFFKRYNERMRLNLVKPLDVLKHFLKHNNRINIAQTHQGLEDKRIVMAEVHGGAALGYFIPEKEYLCMKTFITTEMMHDSQRNVLEAIRKHDVELLQQFANAKSHTWEQISNYVS